MKKKRNYLNAARKAYYLAEMQKAREIEVVDELTADWKMDARIEVHMQDINQFACMQTMSSCFPASLAHFLSPLRFTYVHVALSAEVDRPLMRALREAAKRLSDGQIRLEVVRRHSWTAKAGDYPIGSIPTELRALDIIADQKRYLDVENVYVFFHLEDDHCGLPEVLLERLNEVWHEVIETFEDVGNALEAAPV